MSTKNIRLKPGKLAPKFIGPFQIEECIGEAAYRLKLPSLYSQLHPVFHVSLLEEYIAGAGKQPEDFLIGVNPELADDDNEQEWEVEAILDHKQDGRSKNRRYLIKWKGWPEDHNTWLPAYPNLRNAKELLDSYDENHGLGEAQLPRRRKGPDLPPSTEDQVVEKPKRKRGRPRKYA